VLINENNVPSEWNVNTKIWLKDREEEGQLPNDLITKFENRHSAKELKEYEIPFDFAKPASLIKYLLVISGVEDGDTILDFFSGSATSADALMQLNAEDGGRRRHIQVQLPEITDVNSEPYKAGFRNICEIGKERIRRAGNKIKQDLGNEIAALENKWNNANLELAKEQTKFLKSPDMIEELEVQIIELKSKIEKSKTILEEIDTGFRVYRLSDSNMSDVYYKPHEYKQETLELFADNVKPDRTGDDLLAQVMLAWGLPLSLKIMQTDIDDKLVYKVGENSLYVCFDKGIDEHFAKEIAKDQPLRIVFRDNGFKDDTAKINVKQLLKQLSPDTEMKVI
jgi:adenine-specific DNA-methyltransferase